MQWLDSSDQTDSTIRKTEAVIKIPSSGLVLFNVSLQLVLLSLAVNKHQASKQYNIPLI